MLRTPSTTTRSLPSPKPQGGRRGGLRYALGLAAASAVLNVGCLKQLILEGQIESTRNASVEINTIPDYEVAEKIAMAGLGQLEGYHFLAKDNENALFLLTRSWASVSFGFIEDEMERAEDAEGSGPNWDYHKRRAEAAYDRSLYFGIMLLEQTAPNFKDHLTNEASLKKYLEAFDEPEQAETLFWVGYAWLGRVNVAKEKTALVGEAWVGAAIIERSLALDPTFLHGSGYTALGSYHARTPMAELDEAKSDFDKALAASDGKMLMPKVQLAIRYYCNKPDDEKSGYVKADEGKKQYVKLLEEVLAAGDGDPYQRLANTIAKRKAKRWLGKERMRANCGF
ncbi:MAG: TRAP transporter TatT component family protein [Polyangiaceae bacterium]